MKSRSSIWWHLACAGLVLLVAPGAAIAADEAALAPLRSQLERAENAMLTDPRGVVAIASAVEREASRMAADKPRDRLLARAYWLNGEASGRLGNQRAAQAALAKAIGLIEAGGPRGPLHARVKMSLGSTALDRGAVREAFTQFRDAYSIFSELKDTHGQALALQSMGLIYIDAGDYQRALKFYTQSAEIHSADRALAMSALTNQALAFKEMGRLTPAEQNYRAALAVARELKSRPDQIKILASLAALQLARKEVATAAKTIKAAMALGAGRPETLPLAWAAKAQIAWMQKDARATIALLPKVFGATSLEQTSMDFRDAHQVASDAYRAIGNDSAALAHLRAVNRLDAEAREARLSANTALMAAQFDFSNQELRIARRDVALAATRARTQRLMLWASLLLLTGMLIAFFWIRRSRDATETINVELKKALTAKSAFLATTSHEIRTPLNGIMGMTQVLLHDRAIEATVLERIALIDGAGKTMKAIVDDLLDMAKIEAGEISIDRGEVALPQLIDETARLWAATAEAKGIALSVDHRGAAPRILEDERKLRQILFNLISNAVKFTERGHVAVVARTAGDRLYIEVEDSGIGIHPAERDAIFEAFHQVDGATTRQQGGTGLGLSISNRFALALGGTLSVDSKPGQGSIFRLTLPLILPAADPAEEGIATACTTLAHARILLVDRNPLFLGLAKAVLDGEVAAITTAGSVAYAMTMGRFDLIAIDRATLGDAAVESLAQAAGTSRILLLLPPGAKASASRHEIAKTMPPTDLVAALAHLLDGGMLSRAAA